MNSSDLLEQQLSFKLYVLSRETTKHIKPQLNRLGLTYTQFLVLCVLWENPAIRMHTLCDALFLDSGTLTPVLRKMESDGLLLRQRSTDDTRTLIIRLTDKGMSLKRQGSALVQKSVDDSPLNASEMAQLLHLLDKIMPSKN